MKFVAISDTHGQHNNLVLPEGDVLLHAGDISRKGDKGEIREFMSWLKEQPFKYKVMIAGNHDFFFEKSAIYEVQAEIPDKVIYLNDSGCEIEGIRIWGSPIQPWFFDWAFNRKRGEEIRKHWDLIPENTDILITHGPPYGILDKVVRDNSPVGCRDLLKKVQEIQPKYHIFGHIHEGRGQFFDGNTTFLNASVLDEKYRLVFEPMQFELEAQNAN